MTKNAGTDKLAHRHSLTWADPESFVRGGPTQL